MPKLIDVDILFEAVVRVFADRGYAATTTQEIAARAGVSEVTLFRRYGSKAALIESALIHCLSRSAFGGVVAGEEVRVDLIALVEAYEATNRAYGGAVMTLLTEMPRRPELRNAVSALLPNLENAAHIIQVHQDLGHLSSGDPLRKVAFLLAPLIAAGLWSRSGASAAAVDVNAAEVVDAFLHGHRAD